MWRGPSTRSAPTLWGSGKRGSGTRVVIVRLDLGDNGRGLYHNWKPSVFRRRRRRWRPPLLCTCCFSNFLCSPFRFIFDFDFASGRSMLTHTTPIRGKAQCVMEAACHRCACLCVMSMAYLQSIFGRAVSKNLPLSLI